MWKGCVDSRGSYRWAKSYAYRLNTGKVVVKQKGITLDVANHERFSFEKMKKMVLEGDQL